MDRFDTVNLNRQAGATSTTIGRPKIDVMAEMALGINPELSLRLFPQGLDASNLDSFLDGVDLFVDGLDFFAFKIREQVFARARQRGIPAITAAPIGMGVGFLAFRPGGQSFEQYFHLDGHTDDEKSLRFLMGMAPAGLHRAYLVDDRYVDLKNKRGPSTVAACELCAGMAATQALKILLNRVGVPYAPTHLTFDAYRGKLVRSRLRWGAAGPLQRVKRTVARRLYAAMAHREPPPPPQPLQDDLDAIIDAARWAPSGDNGQPWRLARTGAHSIRVHLAPELDSPYEFRNGQPTWLAGGMLLESLRVAATARRRTISWALVPSLPWTVDVEFTPDDGIEPSAMLPFLFTRSVNRRAMGTGPLTNEEQDALADCLPETLVIDWYHRPSERFRLGRLSAISTDIRLRAAETFKVHRRVIDWSGRDSMAGMPARSVGLNGPTLRIMRWAMRSWGRMHVLNRLTGTRLASAQLDLIPSLRSAAFFVIRCTGEVPASGAGPATILAAGMALQRLWLQATSMRLGFQPAMAMIIFGHHGATATAFTADRSLDNRARKLAHDLQQAIGPLDSVFFAGRIGRLRPGLPKPRSTRLSRTDLARTGA